MKLRQNSKKEKQENMDDGLREKLFTKQYTYGIMLAEMYVPNITRLIARCGFDFILIDCEHGYFDMSQVANLIAVADGANIPVIVRVTQPSRTNITKYLDMGARGILLSDVGGREEALRLADLCRYAPAGCRGISTFRAHTGYRSDHVQELMAQANQRIVVICQIESPYTVEHIDEITSIPGVDGVLIGPNDLSQHMGIFPHYDHPNIARAIHQVAQSAEKNGKFSGIITANPLLLSLGRDNGMRCFSVGSELNALCDGATSQLQRAKQLLEKEVAAQ